MNYDEDAAKVVNPIVWSCGLGINSVALLVGLIEHGERYDLAMFADTGGERNATYEYFYILNEYAMNHHLPPIMKVWRKLEDNSPAPTLEQDCLNRKALPSIAYGYKSCSDNYKIRPQQKIIENWKPAIEAWESDKKVVMLIGFDISESHRIKSYFSRKYVNRYPLVEWEWDRHDCIEAIKRASLPIPPKSSCFFCPSMKPREIHDLMEKEPDKLERALHMERNADLTTIRGLGRNYAWRDVVQSKRQQLSLFHAPDENCDCIV